MPDRDMADQPDGQPSAPADGAIEGDDDARDEESAAAPHHSHSHPAAVGRLVAPAGKAGMRREAIPDHRHDGGGGDASTAIAVTLGSLPDEVLAVVFGFCDARARMMAIPAVSRRWLGVCRHLMRRPAIDLAWAVRNYSCALTDAGLAGLVSRFPAAARINLSCCRELTDGGLGAVAAGCPSLQHLDLGGCESVTDGGAALFPNADVFTGQAC